MQTGEDVVLVMGDSTDSPTDVLEVRIPDAGERGGVERILVTPVGDAYRLVLSPGFVQGIAAGDVVTFHADSKTVEVLSRGGNISVQLFHDRMPDEVVSHVKQQVEIVGGSVDGQLDRLLVFTFPQSVGFTAIENFFGELEKKYPVEWEFGNVFDSNGQPLNWWLPEEG